MNKIQLQPGQTVAQYQRRQRFLTDCMNVSMLVERKPGIPSRTAIADELGLSGGRVKECVKEINRDETPFVRIEYGEKEPKGGPYAGQLVWGWFPMKRASYHEVMEQANTHSAKVEIGVRRSRVIRLLAAHGFTSARAAQVVDSILASLDLDIAKMSQADWDAIFELAMEAPLKV